MHFRSLLAHLMQNLFSKYSLLNLISAHREREIKRLLLAEIGRNKLHPVRQSVSLSTVSTVSSVYVIFQLLGSFKLSTWPDQEETCFVLCGIFLPFTAWQQLVNLHNI